MNIPWISHEYPSLVAEKIHDSQAAPRGDAGVLSDTPQAPQGTIHGENMGAMGETEKK